MATSMWRMNGLCRRMAGVLLLCALLLSNEVMCQDDSVTDATDAPAVDASAVTDAADSAAAPDATAAPDAGATPTAAAGGDSGAASATPGDASLIATIINMVLNPDSQDGGISGAPAAAGAAATVAPGGSQIDKNVGGETSETPSSSGSSVFVGILVTGLLAALAITVGYFKCQRRPDTKGVRLADEACPVDQENQGNTLVSVAPLNPPPETPEKPSVNGESPEAAKTQPPPPTNGHSTAKAADTEL